MSLKFYNIVTTERVLTLTEEAGFSQLLSPFRNIIIIEQNTQEVIRSYLTPQFGACTLHTFADLTTNRDRQESADRILIFLRSLASRNTQRKVKNCVKY